jgi:hypothetical protein
MTRTTTTMLALVCTLVLTACGGGIDTEDEFMGPPLPRPCAVNPASCPPPPTLAAPGS